MKNGDGWNGWIAPTSDEFVAVGMYVCEIGWIWGIGIGDGGGGMIPERCDVMLFIAVRNVVSMSATVPWIERATCAACCWKSVEIWAMNFPWSERSCFIEYMIDVVSFAVSTNSSCISDDVASNLLNVFLAFVSNLNVNLKNKKLKISDSNQYIFRYRNGYNRF